MKTNVLHVVMGISSAGKSTFISEGMNNGSWKKETPIIMAYEIVDDSNELLAGENIVHYNLFRPFNNKVKNINAMFLSDKALNIILCRKKRLKVIFILAQKNIIANRILLRRENETLQVLSSNQYPGDDIFELLCAIDYANFHKQWFNLFEGRSIKFDIYASENEKFRYIENTKKAIDWLSGQPETRQ